MTDPLYKAKVEIGADTKPLKEGISDARAEVESLGDSGEKAGRRGAKGLEMMVNSATRLVGIAGSVVAALTSIGTAIKAVNNYFRDGAKLADEFLSTLDRQGSPDASLERIQTRLIEVNAELQYLEQNPFSIFGRNKGQIEEEIAALERANASLSARIRAQRLQQQRKEIADAKDAVRELNREAQVSLLPENEQIIARANLQIRAIRDLLGEGLGSDEELRRLFDEYRAFINEKKRLELEAFDERMAEQERREIEAAERVIKRKREIFEREMQAVINSLTTSTGGAGDFSSLINTINNVASAIQEAGQNGRRF